MVKKLMLLIVFSVFGINSAQGMDNPEIELLQKAIYENDLNKARSIILKNSNDEKKYLEYLKITKNIAVQEIQKIRSQRNTEIPPDYTLIEICDNLFEDAIDVLIDIPSDFFRHELDLLDYPHFEILFLKRCEIKLIPQLCSMKDYNFLTPTSKHLINFLKIFTVRVDHYVRLIYEAMLRKTIKNNFEKIIIHEKMFEKNFYTFVHGQRREYYWPEKLYTFLWQLKKKRKLNDYIFPHVKDLIETQEDADFEKVQRKFLLATKGGPDFSRRQHVLFMNYALFANTSNYGSSSIYYVLGNSNSTLGTFKLSAKDPFIRLGYPKIYDQFKQEIEDMAEGYNKLSQHGNLLLIAVPKENINNYAFHAESGGHKKPVEIEGVGFTTDMHIIMDALLNHPEKMKDTDKIEFCLIMTQKKGGLDPDTGIKIIPILTGDPQRLAELQKKEEALFAKIKAAIEADEKEKQAAMERAIILARQVVPSQADQPMAAAKTAARLSVFISHVQPTTE